MSPPGQRPSSGGHPQQRGLALSHGRGSRTAESLHTRNMHCSTRAVPWAGEPPSTTWGHASPNLADLGVTADTLHCRPGPLLLLLAQPDFQKAKRQTVDPARPALPARKWIHMFCPQQASLKEYHRSALTTGIPHKSVLNFAILSAESP